MTIEEVKKVILEDKDQIYDGLMFYGLIGNEIWGNCRDGCCRCEYSIEEFFEMDGGILSEEDLEKMVII